MLIFIILWVLLAQPLGAFPAFAVLVAGYAIKFLVELVVVLLMLTFVSK